MIHGISGKPIANILYNVEKFTAFPKIKTRNKARISTHITAIQIELEVLASVVRKAR